MTREDKNNAITEAVNACLDKAVSVMEDNKEEGVRALFSLYVDEEGISVHAVGHSMALDSAYHKALQYVIDKLIQMPRPEERR